MTAVMLAAYPELFKGGAPVAGVPYGCALDSLSAPACMTPGEDMRPTEWGNRVRAAAVGHTAGDGLPKISIWQGLEDRVVNPKNADEIVEEWVNVEGIDDVPDKIDTVNGVTHKSYADANGTIIIEEYLYRTWITASQATKRMVVAPRYPMSWTRVFAPASLS